MEFGYWTFQGRAEFIRWIIAYLALDVKEVNPKDFEEWFQVTKKELGKFNPFINLPYFRDGNFVTAETDAVANAICLKAGREEMLGKGTMDSITVTSIRSILRDLKSFGFALTSRTGEDLAANLPGEYEKKVVPKLKALSTHLVNGGPDRPFLMYYVTIPDFEMTHINDFFAFVEQHTGVENPFNQFPSLAKVCKDVKALPGVSDYLRSSVAERDMLLPSFVKFYKQPEEEQE